MNLRYAHLFPLLCWASLAGLPAGAQQAGAAPDSLVVQASGQTRRPVNAAVDWAQWLSRRRQFT